MAGLQWQLSADGGYFANPKLSKSFRHASQPMMKIRQFGRPEKGFGKHDSDKILIDYAGNLSGRSKTAATRRLSEQVKTPEGKFTTGQTTVTIYEYGFSVPWTRKLETCSEFSVDNLTLVPLRDDMGYALNVEAAVPFLACQVVYTPTGTTENPTSTWATGGTAGDTATRNLMVWDIKQISDYMQGTLFIPKYDGANNIFLAPVDTMRLIFDDSEYNTAAKYGDPDLLFDGEVNRYYKMRFVEDDGALSSTLGTTSYTGAAIITGWDGVAEIVAEPEEIRRKVSTEYGRDKGVGWFFTGGWGEIQPVATAGNVKLVRIDSL